MQIFNLLICAICMCSTEDRWRYPGTQLIPLSWGGLLSRKLAGAARCLVVVSALAGGYSWAEYSRKARPVMGRPSNSPS